VTEGWRECNLLPTAIRDSHYEDLLLDLLLTFPDHSTVESIEDSKLFVRSHLEKWVELTTAAIVNGAELRIATRLLLWNKTRKVPDTSQLGKLLKVVKKTSLNNTPLVMLNYKGQEAHLSVVIPQYNLESEPSNKAMALLISFACSLHTVKPENVSVIVDKAQGYGELTLPNSLQKLMDSLKASASSPLGLFAGENVKFSTGYQGTLPCLLASMRLLSIKQEFLRKRQFKQDSGKSSVSFNSLQEAFNTVSGLKADNSGAYGLRFVKAVLSSCIKPHNKGFPGGWIHANRKVNNIKTDFALVNILGWTERVPSNHKLLEVLFNTVDEESKTIENKRFVEKRSVVNITNAKRNFSHQEFRTALCLSLPRLDVESSIGYDDQLKVDPLSVPDLKITNNFSKDGRQETVDRLNESYNIKVSLRNPKSKTQEVHYKISRDRLLASTANQQLIDARGKIYSTFSELPEKAQAFFRRKYLYPKKRSQDEVSDTSGGVQMELDTATTEVAAPRERPLKRVATMTRGQSAENRRRKPLASASVKPKKK